jgi:replicative DNA helicase
MMIDNKYEMENNVLAYILMTDDNKGIKYSKQFLDKDDFLLENNKLTFRIMNYMEENHIVVDYSTLMAEYKKHGIEKKADLDNWIDLSNALPTTENIDTYIQAVKEISNRVKIKTLTTNLLENLQLTSEQLIDDIKNGMESIEIISNTVTNNMFGNSLNIANTKLRARTQQVISIDTPFKALNRVSKLTNGSLTILAADTGQGKSTMAMTVAVDTVRKGKTVLFVSCEMSEEELIEKTQVTVGQVDINRLIDGTYTDDEIDKIEQGSIKLTRNGGKFIYQSIKDIDKLVNYATKVKRNGNIDLIVIDYIQLMTSRLFRSDTVGRISDVSGKLKALALSLKLPVLALSQFSREGIKLQREPMITDLKGSGSLEQDADTVWLLYKMTELSTITDVGGHDIIQLEIAKARRGKKCQMDLKFRPHVMTFLQDDENIRFPQDYERNQKKEYVKKKADFSFEK